MGFGPWGFKSPLAHYVYPSRSNRRRRRAFIALLLVSIVALVLIAAGSLRSDTRVLVAYFDQARLAAAEHGQLAADFREQILGAVAGLDRERLRTLTTQMSESSQRVAAEVAATEVPAAGAPAAAALSLALVSWQGGLAGFEERLLAAVDDPTDVVAVGELASTLIDLEVGDRAYQQFLTAAAELRGETDVEIGEFPPVGYLPVSVGPLTYAERLADSARKAEGLALRRDVTIAAIRLDPPETGGDSGGIPILPNTESVLFQVVVANDGNRDEAELTVSLRLDDAAGNAVVEEARSIPELAAGTSSTVEFSAIPVTPGENHLATISVSSVPDEADLDNNTRQRPFFVNEPA